MSDTALHLPVRDRQTPTPTPPPGTRLLRSMRRTDALSVKPADLAILHLRIRTDWSNVRSGSSMYIHICWDRLLNLVLKNFAIFFFWMCHLSSCIYLFLCAVSVLAPLTRHEQTGAPRVQRWPKLKSVTSSITSCHPSTPPSALSFLHWRTRPSLFRSEWVVHVLFNIMRTRLPPHPSVLHQVWQQLLRMVMVEQEGAHQQEMKKKRWNFNRWDREKGALLLSRKA